MSKRLKAPLLVGLVAAGGILGAILLFGGVEDRIVGGAGTYRVYALFNDVSGLARYSRVTMAGIPIGKIADIVLSDENGVKAKVILEISDSVALYSGIWDEAQRFYKNGATITRRTATMLGDYYLDISPGIEGERLRDGMRIPNVVGEAGMGALVRKIEELTDIFPTLNKIALDISVITMNLSEVLGGKEGHERMDTIARNITSASKDLAMIAKDFRAFLEEDLLMKRGSLDKIMKNFEIFSQNAAYISQATSDSFVKTMKNFEVITGEIKNFLGKSDAGDQSVEGLRDSIEKLNKSLDELQIAVANMRSVTEKVDSGQGTLGRLINDDKLVEKIEEMAEETGNLVKGFTRLETIVGFRSEYNYHQRAMKNYFSLKLQPRQDKYYLLELVFDPKGSTSTVDRSLFTTDPLKTGAVYEKVVETRSEIKFSLEFAKRLAFVTGRFGIIETTGGVGLDLEFFKDSMKFSFDLFDFNSDRYPRLKWLWTFEFIKHFYLAVGIDDIFNKFGRDYFAGGGMKFTDEDLKALLIAAPLPNIQ